LYEGGVRVPAIMNWPERIRGGQVIGDPCASMDIFPTILAAAGANARDYEIDGRDISSLVFEGKPLGEREIFWEMQQQTAVRRGKWKLVLNGQLVEGAPASDAVHLADLETDIGERTNLKDKQPQITAELSAACKSWRDKIEKRWSERAKTHSSVS
jgi:arylsulfatase A-like enzyme